LRDDRDHPLAADLGERALDGEVETRAAEAVVADLVGRPRHEEVRSAGTASRAFEHVATVVSELEGTFEQAERALHRRRHRPILRVALIEDVEARGAEEHLSVGHVLGELDPHDLVARREIEEDRGVRRIGLELADAEVLADHRIEQRQERVAHGSDVTGARRILALGCHGLGRREFRHRRLLGAWQSAHWRDPGLAEEGELLATRTETVWLRRTGLACRRMPPEADLARHRGERHDARIGAERAERWATRELEPSQR
jgi:hypothetical protein